MTHLHLHLGGSGRITERGQKEGKRPDGEECCEQSLLDMTHHCPQELTAAGTCTRWCGLSPLPRAWGRHSWDPTPCEGLWTTKECWRGSVPFFRGEASDKFPCSVWRPLMLMQPSLNSVSQKIRCEVKRGLVGKKSFRTDMGWQMVMDGVNDQNSEYSHMQVPKE